MVRLFINVCSTFSASLSFASFLFLAFCQSLGILNMYIKRENIMFSLSDLKHQDYLNLLVTSIDGLITSLFLKQCLV